MRYRASGKLAMSKARQYKAWRLRIRLAILEAYGTQCAIPGCGATEGLELDHVNGGGYAHRKALGLFGYRFWAWLIRQGFPPGYQMLCHDHHAEKTTAEKWARRAPAPITL